MPGFDRTGPNGEGPKTGRGLGRCNGHEVEERNEAEYPLRRRLRDASCHHHGGHHRPGYGRGLGRERGFRRGF